MKSIKFILVGAMLVFAAETLKAQEWSVGVDLYSSYVWRGTKLGGPSIQPSINYSNGGFTIGAWGSAGFDGAMEADLFASYEFDFGLSLGVTDYYFPGTEYFDVSTATGAHALEANLGYGIGGFSISGNYVFNEAGGAASAGGDTYIELGYDFEKVSIFAGAGNGWHTPDGEFGLVNVGVSTGKEIKLTDSFSLPVSGSVILNPTTEQFFIVIGISL